MIRLYFSIPFFPDGWNLYCDNSQVLPNISLHFLIPFTVHQVLRYISLHFLVRILILLQLLGWFFSCDSSNIKIVLIFVAIYLAWRLWLLLECDAAVLWDVRGVWRKTILHVIVKSSMMKRCGQIMQLFSVSPPLYGEMQGGFGKFFHGWTPFNLTNVRDWQGSNLKRQPTELVLHLKNKNRAGHHFFWMDPDLVFVWEVVFLSVCFLFRNILY
jgi:hypothetical protein